MKKQKLVRKYRLLKPHEKIQYRDYPFQSNHVLRNGDYYTMPFCFVKPEDYYYGKLVNETRNTVFVRFVDCVPEDNRKKK